MPGKLRSRISGTLKAILLVSFTIAQIFPLLWLFSFSLKDNGEIFGGNVLGLPKHYLWSNYKEALLHAKVSIYFWNSIIVTFSTIAITVVAGSLAAYAIARLRWKLSNAALLFLTIGMMIPVHAALLPLFIILSKSGLLNTRLALIIPYTGFAIPLAVNILTIFFRTIPHELEESAFIDGCNIYKTFYKIMFPLVMPAIATISIFTYISSWNELMFASAFINNQVYKTLTVGIMSMVGQYVTQWGPIGAGLVVATIPSIIGYSFVSAQLPKSISAGAVKG